MVADRSRGGGSIKTLCEDLNPKRKKISERANDLLFQVRGASEELYHKLHLLVDQLDDEHVLGYDGHVKLYAMSAQASRISDELTDLINLIDEKEMWP